MNPFQGKAGELAAVITWLIVSGIALYIVQYGGGQYEGMVVKVAVLQLVYLGAMLVLFRGENNRLLALASLWVMLAAALTMGWMVPLGFLPIYTIIWMAMAPHMYSKRVCYVLFVLLAVAWYVIQKVSWQDEGAFFEVLLFATFHYFALLSSMETIRAERKTAEAEALNRELMATQHLLAEASRQSERTRIARDLHDLLGHHLTALTINLQTAGRMADGEVQDRVETCHALSKLLLSDVREAVSALREQSSLNLAAALDILADHVPGLEIHLDVDDALKIDDLETAESLLRCVQEAVTNTLRHSRATQCWIKVWQEDGQIRVEIHDNGRLSGPLEAGNGLTGMRERIERINGKLRVDSVRQALRIRIDVPAPS